MNIFLSVFLLMLSTAEINSLRTVKCYDCHSWLDSWNPWIKWTGRRSTKQTECTNIETCGKQEVCMTDITDAPDFYPRCRDIFLCRTQEIQGLADCCYTDGCNKASSFKANSFILLYSALCCFLII